MGVLGAEILSSCNEFVSSFVCDGFVRIVVFGIVLTLEVDEPTPTPIELRRFESRAGGRTFVVPSFKYGGKCFNLNLIIINEFKVS